MSTHFTNLYRLGARLVLAVCLSLSLAACGEAEEEAPATVAAPASPVDPADSIAAVYGIGRVEPAQQILTLASETGGVIRSVAVTEGQQVPAGAILMTLDQDLPQARLREAATRLRTQEAQVATSEASLASARIRLENLERQLARTRALATQQAETPEALDNLETEVALQQQEITRWERQIETERRRLAELQAAQASAQTTVAQTELRAPVAGTILEISRFAGEAAPALSGLIDFAPAGDRVVRAEIDELFAPEIKPGQAVTVRRLDTRAPLARGEVIFAADYLQRKSLFAGTAGEQEDRRVREVTVRLEAGSDLLYNSRVEVVIETR